MSEPHSVDHWAALAGDLGAQPAPETTQPPVASETTSTDSQSPAAAAPPAPIFQAPSKAVRSEKKPAKPPAWDQLAGELGIAPMPPPAPPAPKTWEEPKSRIPAPLPAPPAPVAERATSFEPAELAAEIEIEAELTAWNDMEPTATEPHSFEPQEALDFMDDTSEEFSDEYSDELSGEPSEEPAATTEASGEAAPAEGDERRGRRRRRRRGRGRGRDRETTGAPGSVAGEADEAGPAESFGDVEGSFEDVDGGFDEGLESDSAEGGEREKSEEDRGPRRGRSRRRGRGGREPIREEAAGPEEEFVEGDTLEFAEADDEEDDVHADSEFEDFDGDEDEDGGDSPRIGFRNIPTWQDAIGVMIATNMESRAKNPGGSRGPGGRGRGGSGGGGGRGRGRGRGPDRRGGERR